MKLQNVVNNNKTPVEGAMTDHCFGAKFVSQNQRLDRATVLMIYRKLVARVDPGPCDKIVYYREFPATA